MKEATEKVVGRLELLRVRDVCAQLRLSRGYVYRLCAEGKLPVVRLGRKGIRIPADELAAWVAARRQVGTAEEPIA